MRNYKISFPVVMAGFIALLTSCSTLEKASDHGFNSGYYKLDTDTNKTRVYVDVTDETIDVYNGKSVRVDSIPFLSISKNNPDHLPATSLKLRKQSLDIDMTSIMLKYRPSVYGFPSQLTSELNIAMYAGWRFDNYKLTSKTSPTGKNYLKYSNLGYDFGFFAGPGTTIINPFTTNNTITNEYSGMILQTGFAGFLESDFASFGIAIGVDKLLNRDKNSWIYNNKPWIGFIVGIALN